MNLKSVSFEYIIGYKYHHQDICMANPPNYKHNQAPKKKSIRGEREKSTPHKNNLSKEIKHPRKQKRFLEMVYTNYKI